MTTTYTFVKMNCDTNFSRKPGALPVCSLMGAAKRAIFCSIARTTPTYPDRLAMSCAVSFSSFKINGLALYERSKLVILSWPCLAA
jgi:hypothetical protein